MTVNRTTLLDLPLPVTGTESGTWGDTTNNGLTQYMDIAIAGMSNLTSANFTAGALTIETTEGDSSATNISATSAQYAGFRVSSLAVNSTITVGNTGTSPARSYRLINADATYSLTFKATGQTGVTLLPGQSAVVAFNGTDYVIVGVVGAGSTTDNTVPRFDGTTGEILQSSGVTIDDSNNVSGVAQLNITTLDATNIEVTNIKAKDGTAAASIADSTGVISVTANPVLSGGTANGVLYLNGSKVATSGSALTFDGADFSNGAGKVISGGDLRATITGTGNVGLNLVRSGGTAADWYNYIPSGSADLVWYKGSELMRLTSTGLKSSIAGTNADPVFSYTSDTNTGIFFPAADKLGFTAGGGTDQMVLTTTGLGIGTSSPGSKLDVTTSGQDQQLRLVSTGNVVFRTRWVDATTGMALESNNSTETAYYPLTLTGSTLRIGTGDGSLKATLDSSGNLGLGVTPSGWWSSFKAFQFGTVGSVYSGSGVTGLGCNTFYDGTNSKYLTGDNASLYLQTASEHRWYNAPIGTAGNAITFTQAMTLDASGNLGVGTTSPSVKLHVSDATNPSIRVTDTTNPTSVDIQAVDGIGYVGTPTNHPLALFTNGSERARITSGGALLVGATSVSGSETLRVYNSTNSRVIIDQASNGLILGADASGPFLDTSGSNRLAFFIAGTERARITSGGDFLVKGAGTAGSTDAFQVSGSAPADAARLDSSGNLGLGGSAARATTAGSAIFNIFNGTAPVGTLTNGISLYSSSGEAYVMDAAGNATLFSPHDRDTNEWIFRSKHTPSGKVLKIDVERLLRFVNDHFGLDAVQEFIEP